jgi:hypothetical protein
LIRTNRPFSGGQAGQINQAGDKDESTLPDGFNQSGEENLHGLTRSAKARHGFLRWKTRFVRADEWGAVHGKEIGQQRSGPIHRMRLTQNRAEAAFALALSRPI